MEKANVRGKLIHAAYGFFIALFASFVVAGMELFKRLTLITLDGRIEKVFYPVFPPDRNADEVLVWLRESAQPGSQPDAAR